MQHLLLRLSEQTSHRERFWAESGQHSPAPAALPLRWSGPHKAHIMSLSYSRPSQGITAERAWPSPGVADEDVEAERVAAVQGHRASARSAELEPGRGPLCTYPSGPISMPFRSTCDIPVPRCFSAGGGAGAGELRASYPSPVHVTGRGRRVAQDAVCGDPSYWATLYFLIPVMFLCPLQIPAQLACPLMQHDSPRPLTHLWVLFP